ncbi:MAG: N-acetyltransferase [Hymenobacter sp.]|nr:MAG: N-acetyltransferase [Hymenobacter sp.]
MSIKHNPSEHTFTDGEAELAYSTPSPQIIDFTHTFVPEDRRGEGVGEALATAGLDYARQHHLRVVPTCPFVAAFMQKHKEYADLLAQ